MRALILAAGFAAAAFAQPLFESELIFPVDHWHNHASSVVELPNGDLFAVWYHGSGERTADDVLIEASRLKKGATQWQTPFTVADVPGFPDCNPALLLDSRQRLWLLWPVILANQWETALMKYKIASDYSGDGVPKWDVSEEMLFRPRNFTRKVHAVVDPMVTAGTPGSRQYRYLAETIRHAEDKYFRRMGWMTRAHPVELPSGRILVPLYSDGFSFSLIGITDDGGRSWKESNSGTSDLPPDQWGATLTSPSTPSLSRIGTR